MSSVEEPRNIKSARPFQWKAQRYRELGWEWPIPIPAKEKGPPPTKYTGKFDEKNQKGLPVTEKVLNRWLNSPSSKLEKANIAQHLGFDVVLPDSGGSSSDSSVGEDSVGDSSGEEWVILGIDIDHRPEHENPGERKFGGEQLSQVEARLGEKLPPTWVNSAESNGIHGHWMYLVPKGLQWRGNCAELGGKHIDIISVGHKYAVQYPSIHPNGKRYLWYPPGVKPLGSAVLRGVKWSEVKTLAVDSSGSSEGYKLEPGEICCIPRTIDLPKLGPKWIEFLSRGGLSDPGAFPMDMEIEDKDLKTWAIKNFAPGNQKVLEKRTGETTLAEYDGMCFMMRKRLAAYLERVVGEDASHYPLQDGHWELLRLGMEGHTGWASAIKKLELAWQEEVMSRHKRTADKMNKEIYRSLMGSLRKVKGEIDEARGNGLDIVSIEDTCYHPSDGIVSGENGGPPINFREIPRTPAAPPDKYSFNDDGNGLHWLDLHKGHVLWIPNVLSKWIIWDGGKWIVDEIGLARTLYRRVKVRQENFARKLAEDYERDKGKKNQNVTRLKELRDIWKRWATQSGNTTTVTRALMAAQDLSERERVSFRYEELNKDRRALGSGSKVLQFNKTGKTISEVINIIDNSKELLITKNTGHEYIPLAEQAKSLDLEIRKGYNLFQDFLNKFIAPSIDLDYFQKLCGSVVLGDESNKFALFFWGPKDTGKSTMADLIRFALGDYACTRNPDFFKGTRLNPALAKALSMRMVTIDELGDNVINSNLFKSITGGNVIQCELKGSNNLIEDFPQFTIIITTNQVPNVPGEDAAFRERLRVIKFKHQVTGAEKEQGIKTRRDLLEQGKIACFAWLVEGAARSVIEGLYPIPSEILLATEDFAAELSDIGVFVRDCLAESSGNFLRNEDLFNHFRAWAINNNFNERDWTPNKLSRKMKDFGYTSTKRYVTDEDGKKIQVRGYVNLKCIKGKDGE